MTAQTSDLVALSHHDQTGPIYAVTFATEFGIFLRQNGIWVQLAADHEEFDGLFGTFIDKDRGDEFIELYDQGGMTVEVADTFQSPSGGNSLPSPTSSMAGPGVWKFRLSPPTAESSDFYTFEVHDSATATTSVPFKIKFEGYMTPEIWVSRYLHYYDFVPQQAEIISGTVSSDVAGPIINELYNVGNPGPGGSLFYYSSYYGPHPLPVIISNDGVISLARL